MNEPNTSSPEDGKSILSATKTPRRESMEHKIIQFIFRILLGAKTAEIVLKIDEWIRQSQGEDGQHFFPETRPSSSSSHGNDKRKSDFFKGTERKYCAFPARCGKKCGSLREAQALDISCTLVQDRRRLGTLKTYPDKPKGK